MYAIMRTKKHKAGGGLATALQHLYRERNTPNADDSKTPQNITLVGSSDEPSRTKAARERLEGELKRITDGGRKIRADAVVAVEYVMTASPDYWSDDPVERERQAREFADRSTKWIAEQYPEGCVFAAEVHMDETSPHVSLFVTPTVSKLTKRGDQRLTLSAKTILGGSQKLSAHQSSFHQAVADLGLERGIEKSYAQHTPVNKFYGRLVKMDEDSKGRAKRALNRLAKNEPMMMTGKYYKTEAQSKTRRVAELEAANASLSKTLRDTERTSGSRLKLLKSRDDDFRQLVQESFTNAQRNEIRAEIEQTYAERLADLERREREMERQEWIVANYDRENNRSAVREMERLEAHRKSLEGALETVIERTCDDLIKTERALRGLDLDEAKNVLYRRESRVRKYNPDSPDLPENRPSNQNQRDPFRSR